jgi:hypothetical protein
MDDPRQPAKKLAAWLTASLLAFFVMPVLAMADVDRNAPDLPDPTSEATFDNTPNNSMDSATSGESAISESDCKFDALTAYAGHNGLGEPFPKGVSRTIAGSATFVDGTPYNDYIVVSSSATASHITIDGEGGTDLIVGSDGAQTIIGGPGDDYLIGGHGADLIVGDDYATGQSADGRSDRDCLVGSQGADTLVGDNMGVDQNASGGDDDILLGGDDKDLIIGDSSTSGASDHSATGFGNDWMAGSQGPDTVVGDSYAKGVRNAAHGRGSADAANAGNDSVNTGPDDDLGVGDSLADGGSAMADGSSADTEKSSATPDGTISIWPDRVDAKRDAKDGGVHLQNGNDEGWGDSRVLGGSGAAVGGGSDEIGGSDGADSLFGGPGDDTVRGDSAVNCTHTPTDSIGCQPCPTKDDVPRCVFLDPSQGGNSDDPGHVVKAAADGVNWNDTLYGGPDNDKLFGYWGDGDVCSGGGDSGDSLDPTCDPVAP